MCRSEGNLQRTYKSGRKGVVSEKENDCNDELNENNYDRNEKIDVISVVRY